VSVTPESSFSNSEYLNRAYTVHGMPCKQSTCHDGNVDPSCFCIAQAMNCADSVTRTLRRVITAAEHWSAPETDTRWIQKKARPPTGFSDARTNP
jgi:hypothetical protein